jgi:hypothetical protein
MEVSKEVMIFEGSCSEVEGLINAHTKDYVVVQLSLFGEKDGPIRCACFMAKRGPSTIAMPQPRMRMQ